MEKLQCSVNFHKKFSLKKKTNNLDRKFDLNDNFTRILGHYFENIYPFVKFRLRIKITRFLKILQIHFDYTKVLV